MALRVRTRTREFEINAHQRLHLLRQETVDVVLHLSAVLHVVDHRGLVPFLVVGVVFKTLRSTTNESE